MSSSFRIQKSGPARSTLQRHNQAQKILKHGRETMAPCSNCRRVGALCVMLKGQARCSCCTRKNMSCDGQYSEEEYMSLEDRKRQLRD